MFDILYQVGIDIESAAHTHCLPKGVDQTLSRDAVAVKGHHSPSTSSNRTSQRNIAQRCTISLVKLKKTKSIEKMNLLFNCKIHSKIMSPLKN